MKTLKFALSILILAVFMSGCSLFGVKINPKSITPSKNIITEQRSVANFTAIDMRTVGNVSITQGAQEALIVKGSDNLLALVKTYVQNGVLVIEEVEDVNFEIADDNNRPSYTITVKDLKSLTVTGLSQVEMGALSTNSLRLAMSGAGGISLARLAVNTLDIVVSGLGHIAVAGNTGHTNIEISGSGDVKAADLQTRTASILIPGLGNATLWVTDELTGTISGGGTVRYYGAPRVSTQIPGLGKFEPLGSK